MFRLSRFYGVQRVFYRLVVNNYFVDYFMFLQCFERSIECCPVILARKLLFYFVLGQSMTCGHNGFDDSFSAPCSFKVVTV